MNIYETLRKLSKVYKMKFPKGTRIQLIQMGVDPQPIPLGKTGTIDFIDDLAQIHVSWDNGSTLALVPQEDLFRIIS